jgi:hypothetical protein
MKKGNILFVSLICIAALTGNAFCAKVQDEMKEIKASIAAFAGEDIKTLAEEINQQDPNGIMEQVSAKLEKVKKEYPASAGEINNVFAAIKELSSRRSDRLDFLAQNYVTPLERDLSPALIALKNQNTGAFYATMSVIDVEIPTQRGYRSLSSILDFVNGYLPFEGSQIRDTDNLIDSLGAQPYQDALWLFGYLQKNEPDVKQTTGIIEEKFKCVLRHYNSQDFGSKVWAQNAEGCLEDFEYVLSTIKVLNPRLYGKVLGIMNRKYPATNGKKLSIAEMKDKVNESLRNYILADTGLVQDPHGILSSMDAYSK